METRNPFASAKIVGKQVSPAAYHKQTVKRGDPAYVMSRGELMEFAHCPARWKNNYSKKDTDASEWGTLIDGLLMMTDRQFDATFAVAPAMYPCESTKRDPRTEKPWNNNATFCSEWKDEQEAAGKTVIKTAELMEARRAVTSLRDDPVIAKLIDTSAKQVHVLAEYKDHDTGLTIPVKSLIDLVPPLDSEFGMCLGDFKTAFSAAPFVWTRTVAEHYYHCQAAIYLDGYTAATGEDRNTFLHIIQESYAPWQTGKRFLSHEFIELGRLKYVGALKLYCACLASGVWPGYERGDARIGFNGFEVVEPQQWMLQQ